MTKDEVIEKIQYYKNQKITNSDFAFKIFNKNEDKKVNKKTKIILNINFL